MTTSPHQAVIEVNRGPSWKKSVPETPELRRILSIPRREWTEAEAQELAIQMTELLKTPKGTMTLRPFQAVGLHDLCAYGGLVGMGRVGVGKTLLSFLSPYVCEAHRPLLMHPANLREKTLRDVYFYKDHWEISSMMDMQSYELLARSNQSYYLDVTKPDLIVCDEAHHLKNTKAAVTRRLKRYLEACRSDKPEYADYPKNVKLVLLSGTFTNRSIKEYWHLLKWVLPRDQVPLPLELAELELWSLCLDEKVKPGQRVSVGALEKFFNDEERALQAEGKDLSAARRAYGRRLVQTPGVVATTETFSGSQLTITDLQLTLPVVVKEAFHKLRGDWKLPDDEEISDGMLAAKAAKELALGFYYRWNPWPPEDWVEARREWCQFVRRTLSRNKLNLDTEEQVKNAVMEGLYPSEKLKAWLAVKDTFEINVEAVWLSDFAVDAAVDWARKRKGIVWVHHSAFGKRLEKKSGIPYYGEGGFSSDGKFIENHPVGTPLIASIKANKEGKNLQGWARNLVCHPPSSGSWWEQMIGRTHRDGQQAALVTFEMFASCIEHYQAFERACGDAMYTQDSTPMVQKLLYADIDVPSPEDAELLIGEEWHAGQLKD